MNSRRTASTLRLAAVGVRALQPFAEPNAFAQLPEYQRYLFTGVDVLLSAALLAGGADGIQAQTDSCHRIA